jgi:hypothetical protein
MREPSRRGPRAFGARPCEYRLSSRARGHFSIME